MNNNNEHSAASRSPEEMAVHFNNQYSPTAARLRNGLLAGVGLNIYGIATALHYGYQSEIAAAGAGIHPRKHSLLRCLCKSVEKWFYTQGGHPQNLYEMVCAGAEKTEPAINLNEYKSIPVTSVIPVDMFHQLNKGVTPIRYKHWSTAQQIPDLATQVQETLVFLRDLRFKLRCYGSHHSAMVPGVVDGKLNPLLAKSEQQTAPVTSRPDGVPDAVRSLAGETSVKETIMQAGVEEKPFSLWEKVTGFVKKNLSMLVPVFGGICLIAWNWWQGRSENKVKPVCKFSSGSGGLSRRRFKPVSKTLALAIAA
jgi:hypothetical protein